MRVALFVVTVSFCIAPITDQALAQAGTGGINDGPAAPSMVIPVRPRDEPPTSRPVPNVYRYYRSPPVARLRRTYPTYQSTPRSK